MNIRLHVARITGVVSVYDGHTLMAKFYGQTARKDAERYVMQKTGIKLKGKGMIR